MRRFVTLIFPTSVSVATWAGPLASLIRPPLEVQSLRSGSLIILAPGQDKIECIGFREVAPEHFLADEDRVLLPFAPVRCITVSFPDNQLPAARQLLQGLELQNLELQGAWIDVGGFQPFKQWLTQAYEEVEAPSPISAKTQPPRSSEPATPAGYGGTRDKPPGAAMNDSLIDALNAYVPSPSEGENSEILTQLGKRIAQETPTRELIRAALQVFERFPEADFGTPGPLVHGLDKHWLKGGAELLEEELAESVRRKPVHMNLWMINRILNTPLPDERRARLVKLLTEAANHPDASAAEIAQDYLEHQSA